MARTSRRPHRSMSIRALSVASAVGTLPKHVVRPSSSTSSEAAAMIMARASSLEQLWRQGEAGVHKQVYFSYDGMPH